MIKNKTKREIVKLYTTQALPLKKLEKMFHHSSRDIVKVLKEAGVPPRRNGLPQKQYDYMVEQLLSGISPVIIAKELGITIAKLKSIIRYRNTKYNANLPLGQHAKTEAHQNNLEYYRLNYDTKTEQEICADLGISASTLRLYRKQLGMTGKYERTKQILLRYPNEDTNTLAEEFGTTAERIRTIASKHKVHKDKAFLSAVHTARAARIRQLRIVQKQEQIRHDRLLAMAEGYV